MTDPSKTVPFLLPTTEFGDLSQAPLEVNWDSLLNDTNKLQLLYFLTNSYTRLFDSAKHNCLRLLDYSDVHYLLDFDVIRNYIEMRTFDKLDTFAVDFFFAHSKAKFSIPLGAFQELLDYLAHIQRTHSPAQPNLRPSSALEAKRFIANSLLIDGADKLDSSSLDEAFEQSLDTTLVQLIRLLSLLNSDRFQGVAAEYSHDHFAAWLSVVKQLERPYRRNARTDVDQRDAMNLAIASTSLPRGQKAQTLYLLISQTGTLLTAPSNIDDKGWDELEMAFQVDREILRYLYPTIHPRDAMVLELLGALNDSRSALTRAEAYEETFRQLGNHLRAEVISTREPRDLYLKAFATFIVERRRQTRELLKQAAQGILTEQDELRKIEDVRSLSASIDLRRQRGRSVPEDPREGRSLFFRRLLGQVARSLGVKTGIVYETSLSEPSSQTPFYRFTVSEAGGNESLLAGEMYVSQANAESTREYYAIRWPISCLEDQFIEAIATTWVINEASYALHKDQQLRRVELDDDLWTEGVIVSFPDSDFGLPLSVVYGNGDWRLLHLAELAKLMTQQSTIRLPDSTTLHREIQRIRINTLYGDVLYDVTVCSGNDRRYLTILSDRNLALQITGLYTHTGQSFCIPQKLLDALNTLLQTFPPHFSVAQSDQS